MWADFNQENISIIITAVVSTANPARNKFVQWLNLACKEAVEHIVGSSARMVMLLYIYILLRNKMSLPELNNLLRTKVPIGKKQFPNVILLTEKARELNVIIM